MTLPMLQHQIDALAFLRRRGGRGALFMEPGLGKTRVGYELAARARRTLVLAPLNPAEFVWPDQHKEWAPKLSFRLARGTPKERARILFDERPDVAVMNYELLRWFYDEVRARRRLPYDLCILDESTHVKSSSTVAFRVMQTLLPIFDAVVPMTGTPAENSLADVWGQLYMVDEGAALGKKIGVFRERYCKAVTRENYVSWVVSRPEELMLAAAPLSFVRRADDCLDMPALTFRDVPFELSKSERKIYDRVKMTHTVPLPEPIPLDNAGVALDKLRQITSGFVYDEAREPHFLGTAKLDALRECVEESFGQPMLIGFWYQGSKRAIQRALGAPAIDRFTSSAEKRKLLDQWRAGQLPVLLGQVKTVALGLNMQSPDASIVFYDMPWSHGQHWQFIRRVWRQHQKTRVIVRRLIARRTVDAYVAMVLARKQQSEADLMTTILNEEQI